MKKKKKPETFRSRVRDVENVEHASRSPRYYDAGFNRGGS